MRNYQKAHIMNRYDCQMRTAVIGAGNMGEALIAGLIAYGETPANIAVCEKRAERATELVNGYGISIAEIADSVRDADAVLLVVKPQDMAAVLAEVGVAINPAAVVVSFAAGKKIDFISANLGKANPVIRVMPNTATMVGAGMAAISLGNGVTSAQREFVAGFLAKSGQVVEVAEELQDAVTATSGSGPAYFFAFTEVMVAGAQELGLSAEVATQLTVQTLIGAAKLLAESGKSATELRENVTSPNGTTAAALASFNEGELAKLVAKSMKAARDRSIELA
jgi:pyrroline-5-carboxylate reductase